MIPLDGYPLVPTQLPFYGHYTLVDEARTHLDQDRSPFSPLSLVDDYRLYPVHHLIIIYHRDWIQLAPYPSPFIYTYTSIPSNWITFISILLSLSMLVLLFIPYAIPFISPYIYPGLNPTSRSLPLFSLSSNNNSLGIIGDQTRRLDSESSWYISTLWWEYY